MDTSVDGILSVDFKHKYTDYTFVIVVCYLSPENSSWSRNNTQFFAHLITKLCSCSYADTTFLLGDFNARIGKYNDVIEGIADIIKRIVIDYVKNPRGYVFVDFLRDLQLCTVNGGITPEYDYYTFLSSRGKSLVDYILTPLINLAQCISCKVQTVHDLIDQHDLVGLIGDRCQPPMPLNYNCIL